MRIRNGISLISILLVIFTCAPVRVKIYEREIPSEKTTTVKPSPVKTSPEKISTINPFSEKTYDEAILEWTSYQELVRWMENDFAFDKERFKKFEGRLPAPRSPEKTFQLKSGIYIDAAMFLKETLNRINPSYKAQVVVLVIRPNRFNHYVCSFKKDNKLFIMDYGTPYREITGVHGPYHSLEEYKKFYERHYPIKRKIEAISDLP